MGAYAHGLKPTADAKFKVRGVVGCVIRNASEAVYDRFEVF